MLYLLFLAGSYLIDWIISNPDRRPASNVIPSTWTVNWPAYLRPSTSLTIQSPASLLYPRQFSTIDWWAIKLADITQREKDETELAL